MKKILNLIAVFCLSAGAFAQVDTVLPVPDLPVDGRTGKVTYRGVVTQEGTPRELYGRALAWVKDYYKNTGEVIKSADTAANTLQLRSSVRIYYINGEGMKHFKNIVYYNLKIECRSNRYRYTITDFNEKAQARQPVENWFNTGKPGWDPSCYDFLNQVNDQVKALIGSLEEGMAPKAEFIDEW